MRALPLAVAMAVAAASCGGGESAVRPRPDAAGPADAVEAGAAEAGGDSCVPSCKGRECGPDGCGGSCGTCSEGEECKADFRCGPACADDPFEPDGDDEPVSLVFDEPVVRSICPGGDVDWHEFEMTSETEVRIRTSGTSGVTRITLLDEELNEIEHKHGAEFQGFTLLEETIRPGRYLVRVEAEDEGQEVGSYKLTISLECMPDCGGRECGDDGCGGSCGTCAKGLGCDKTGRCTVPCLDAREPDDVPGKAGTIQSGEIVVRGLCVPGDQDWFVFELGGRLSRVRVETSGTEAPTEVWLFDQGFVMLEHDGSDDGGPASVIDEDDLPQGTYYIKVMADHAGDIVEHYSTTIGVWCVPDCDGRPCGDDGCGGTCGSCGPGYECDLAGQCLSTCADAQEPDASASAALPLANGDLIERSICPPGDHDWYRFALDAAARVRIETAGQEAPTEVWLRAHDLVQLDHDGHDEAGPYSYIDLDLPAGEYYVEVAADHSSDQVPHYTVGLSVTQP